MNINKTSKTLKDKIINLRGTIIDDCIVLERLIDVYLACYFTTNNVNKTFEILELILSNERMSFEGKKQVFCYLMKSYNGSFNKKHPSANKELSYIIEQRNIFAHYLFQLNGGYVEAQLEKVGFIKYKNKTEVIDFTNEKIHELRIMIAAYVNSLVALMDENGYEISTPPSNSPSVDPGKSS